MYNNNFQSRINLFLSMYIQMYVCVYVCIPQVKLKNVILTIKNIQYVVWSSDQYEYATTPKLFLSWLNSCTRHVRQNFKTFQIAAAGLLNLKCLEG